MLGLVASVVAMEKAGEMMDFLFGPSCIVDEKGKIWGPEKMFEVFDEIFKKEKRELNLTNVCDLQKRIISRYS